MGNKRVPPWHLVNITTRNGADRAKSSFDFKFTNKWKLYMSVEARRKDKEELVANQT
jgi:hypothetical protein